MRITRSFLLLTVGALAIAACGGGGGDAEETTTTAAPTTTSTTVPETTTTVAETTTTEAATTTTELPAVIRQPLTGQPLGSLPLPVETPRRKLSLAMTYPAWRLGALRRTSGGT